MTDRPDFADLMARLERLVAEAGHAGENYIETAYVGKIAGRCLAAIKALVAERDALLSAAFDAGFRASSEGWNGEYPGDAETYPHYIERRAAAIRALEPEPPR